MNTIQPQFKERRIWYFTCEKCGKAHRQSHRKKNAQVHICRKCRGVEVAENQLKIFEEQNEG